MADIGTAQPAPPKHVLLEEQAHADTYYVIDEKDLRLALRSRHGVASIYLDEIYVSYSREQFGND